MLCAGSLGCFPWLGKLSSHARRYGDSKSLAACSYLLFDWTGFSPPVLTGCINKQSVNNLTLVTCAALGKMMLTAVIL